MGLGRPGAIFTQEWVDRLAPVPKLAYAATVKVFDPNTGDLVFVPGTDGEPPRYTGDHTTIYAGPARVQPLRQGVLQVNNADDTVVQSVLVSITGASLDIRPKHRMTVTSAPLNPVLKAYEYVVHEVMDSSNPIERTVLCKVDTEVEVSG